VCKKVKRLYGNHPAEKTKGKVCSGCYQRLTDPVAVCGVCKKVKRLRFNHPTEDTKGRVCSSCYQRLIAQ
jgi:hypothetical protein